MHRRLNDRIEVHGKQHVQLGMQRRHVGDRAADLLDLIAPALPPVHGHEQMPAAFGAPAHALVLAAPLLRVDGRVAGDVDVAVGECLR